MKGFTAALTGAACLLLAVYSPSASAETAPYRAFETLAGTASITRSADGHSVFRLGGGKDAALLMQGDTLTVEDIAAFPHHEFYLVRDVCTKDPSCWGDTWQIFYFSPDSWRPVGNPVQTQGRPVLRREGDMLRVGVPKEGRVLPVMETLLINEEGIVEDEQEAEIRADDMDPSDPILLAPGSPVFYALYSGRVKERLQNMGAFDSLAGILSSEVSPLYSCGADCVQGSLSGARADKYRYFDFVVWRDGNFFFYVPELDKISWRGSYHGETPVAFTSLSGKALAAFLAGYRNGELTPFAAGDHPCAVNFRTYKKCPADAVNVPAFDPQISAFDRLASELMKESLRLQLARAESGFFGFTDSRKDDLYFFLNDVMSAGFVTQFMDYLGEEAAERIHAALWRGGSEKDGLEELRGALHAFIRLLGQKGKTLLCSTDRAHFARLDFTGRPDFAKPLKEFTARDLDIYYSAVYYGLRQNPEAGYCDSAESGDASSESLFKD
jgi:hypothetical protein